MQTIYSGQGGNDDVRLSFPVPAGVASSDVQLAVGTDTDTLAVGANPTWLAPTAVSIGDTSAIVSLRIGAGFVNPVAGDYVLWYRAVTPDGRTLIQPQVSTARFAVTDTNGSAVAAVGPFVETISVNGGAHQQPDSGGNVDLTVSGGGGAGVASFNTRTGVVSLTKADVIGTGLAKADLALGNVDNTSDVNKPVSTAQAAADAAVQAFAIQRGNHTGTQAESTITNLVSDLAAKAPLASPALTGTPTAPTAAPGTNTTQLATTAYADAAAIAATVGLLDYRGTYNASGNTFPASGGSGSAGAVLKGDFWVVSTPGTLGGAAVANGDLVIALIDTPGSTAANWDLIEHDVGYAPENVANKSTDGTLAANSATLYPSQSAVKTYADGKVENAVTAGHTSTAPSGDSVSTALAQKAPLASPALTGNPTAPTQPAADNSTKLATTAYADAAAAARASVLTRTAVKTGNYTAALGDLVPCDVSGGAFTVTLPAASGGKGRIAIKVTTAGNTLNLALTGSDHFNTSAGPTTGTLTLGANQGIVVESDGAGIWTVTSDDLPLSLLDARYVNNTLADAKGDLLVATADNTVARLAVGADTFVLTADAAQPAGVKWAAAAGGSGGGLATYGDGSDGAVTFDGTTTVLGMVPSSSVYTLTRSFFFANVTINSGVTIIGNSFHVFWTGTLTNNGTIKHNGVDSTGAAGGGQTSNGNGSISNTVLGQLGGAAGASPATVGTAGSGTSDTYGGGGGAGGAGSGAAGGSGGTATAPTSTTVPPRSLLWAVLGGALSGGRNGFARLAAGAGGGGAGPDGTGQGGGGGGGGGVLILCGKTIAGTGVIQARGGKGGDASGGNRGGGGGGGGGWIALVSGSVSAGAVAGQTIDANGGAGGAKTGTGVAGTAGSNGTVFLIPN